MMTFLVDVTSIRKGIDKMTSIIYPLLATIAAPFVPEASPAGAH